MLVSLHQGLFFYCGKIRGSCSVFRGVRLLQTVSFITAGGSAAFGIRTSALGIRTAATTWVIVWVFHIALIVGGNVLHNLSVAVVAGNLDGGFLQFALDVNAWGEDNTAVGNQTGSHFASNLSSLASNLSSLAPNLSSLAPNLSPLASNLSSLASVPSDSIACPPSFSLFHPAFSPSASIFPISIPQSFPPSHSVPGIVPW